MTKTFRKLLTWTLMLAFVSAFVVAQSGETFAAEPMPVPETTKIKVGLLSASAAMTPLWAARDGGYFEKYGLDVEIIMLGTSARTVAALLSGDIQFGTVGIAQVLNATAGGGDMVAISDMISRSTFRLFGADGIESVEDLRGKRIGVPSLGSSAEMEIRFILAHHGMEVPRDAQIVGIGGLAEIFSALVNGSIQAGILSAPLSFNAVDSGMKLLVTPAQLREWNIPSDQTKIVTRRAWLERNPVAAELFMKAFLEGLHRTINDKDFALRVISENTGVDLATAERAYADLRAGYGPVRAYITEERVGIIKDFLMSTTDNPRLANTPNSLAIDMSILMRLDESGFIDSLDNE